MLYGSKLLIFMLVDDGPTAVLQLCLDYIAIVP